MALVACCRPYCLLSQLCVCMCLCVCALFSVQKVPALTPPEALLGSHYGDFERLPPRRPDYNFTEASPVLQNALR
jgi:hypothetical protein